MESHVSLNGLTKKLEDANYAPNAVRLEEGSSFSATYKYTHNRKDEEGQLQITKKVEGQKVHFDINFEPHQQVSVFFKINANVICNNKAVSVPTSWQYSSQVYRKVGRKENQHIKSADLTRKAIIQEGVLKFDDDQPQTKEIKNLFTTNWTLLCDMHKILLAETKLLKLDMCEDLLILKPDVRLEWIGTVQEPMPLNGYCCWGTALPPIFYWLDSNNQLVLATCMFADFVLSKITEIERRIRCRLPNPLIIFQEERLLNPLPR